MGNNNLAPIEKLELLLPGFRFYKSMDLIKQDDAMVRYALKNNLEKIRELIESKEGDLVSRNPMDESIKDFERVLVLLRTLIQEIFASPTGMYTYYSRYKIDENNLNDILNHDYSLISISKEILENFEKMGIGDLVLKIKNLRNLFSEREKYFIQENIR